MPEDKTTKPRYELRKQSKNYVCLWEGNHNLCSICTNTKGGAQDAQLILLAMNSYTVGENGRPK